MFLNVIQRLYFLTAFHFYAKSKITRSDTISMLGFTLHVPSGVFHPMLYFSSKFLASYLREIDLGGKEVLDMGCGSGILSLVAASQGARVTSIDINPLAVKSTLQNAQSNHLADFITVLESNLFEQLGNKDQKFDYVIVNPPYYKVNPQSMAERAWFAGTNLDFISSFAKTVRNFLKPNGRILIILSSKTDIHSIIEVFQNYHFSIETLHQRRVLFETLYIFRAAVVNA